eukprot:366301-Chlamydomonas_euryale.AAC.51
MEVPLGEGTRAALQWLRAAAAPVLQRLAEARAHVHCDPEHVTRLSLVTVRASGHAPPPHSSRAVHPPLSSACQLTTPLLELCLPAHHATA